MAEPVISYPGAKWRFYTYMQDYFPENMKTFIEPFLGGASVTLSVSDDNKFKSLERIICGDLAPEIWAFWTGVKEAPEEVIKTCYEWWGTKCPKHTEFMDSNRNQGDLTEEEYEAIISEGRAFWKWSQEVDCSTLSIPERAARIFLVNKISFSGMGDSGSMSRDQLMDFKLDKTERISKASKLLQKVTILNASFEETMEYSNEDPENTFIFLDPPYWKQESSGLYGRGGDTHKGFPHEHFAEVTKQLKCKWFMTYDDSIFVRRQFAGNDAYGNEIHIIPFVIPGGYTMAGKTSEDALAGEELFILNYEADSMKEFDINDL